HDAPARVPQRIPARLKPAVDAVETPTTYFPLERLARRDRLGEVLHQLRQIFRMYRTVGPPVLELLEGQAKELQALAVDEFDLAIVRKGYDQPWNAVYDQTRLALAFAECLFSALAFVDVRHQHAPPLDLSFRVADRKAP